MLCFPTSTYTTAIKRHFRSNRHPPGAARCGARSTCSSAVVSTGTISTSRSTAKSLPLGILRELRVRDKKSSASVMRPEKALRAEHQEREEPRRKSPDRHHEALALHRLDREAPATANQLMAIFDWSTLSVLKSTLRKPTARSSPRKQCTCW